MLRYCQTIDAWLEPAIIAGKVRAHIAQLLGYYIARLMEPAKRPVDHAAVSSTNRAAVVLLAVYARRSTSRPDPSATTHQPEALSLRSLLVEHRTRTGPFPRDDRPPVPFQLVLNADLPARPGC